MDGTWKDMGGGQGGSLADSSGKVTALQECTPRMERFLLDDDVEGTRMTAQGGRLIGKIADATGFGRLAPSKDPAGLRFGLHQ
ncbi:MAG: hypothetical protein ABJL67_12025 [Sulfitobacter sp.]